MLESTIVRLGKRYKEIAGKGIRLHNIAWQI